MYGEHFIYNEKNMYIKIYIIYKHMYMNEYNIVFNNNILKYRTRFQGNKLVYKCVNKIKKKYIYICSVVR